MAGPAPRLHTVQCTGHPRAINDVVQTVSLIFFQFKLILTTFYKKQKSVKLSKVNQKMHFFGNFSNLNSLKQGVALLLALNFLVQLWDFDCFDSLFSQKIQLHLVIF